MKIGLIVRDIAPGTGLDLVVQNLVQGLHERHAVRLFVVSPGYYKRRSAITADWEFEEYSETAGASAAAGGPSISRASRYYGVDERRLGWLQARIDSYAPDRIVGFDFNSAAFLGMLDTRAPRILNAIDSEILYHAGQLSANRPTLAGLKHVAAAVLVSREHFSKFSAVVSVSSQDSRNLQAWGGNKRVFTVPNGVDHRFYAPAAGVRKKPASVVFCGSLSFAPNVQAVEWFIGGCWGQIRAARPDAEFVVIGKNPPAGLAQQLETQPGIRVTGFVDDVRPHIQSCEVSIAPMVSGSGIKNKILEAWALGMPVVSSRHAVTGLNCESGANILIAGTAGEFARSVLSLLNDAGRREMMGAAAREHVVRNYSWETSRSLFNSIVEGGVEAGEIEESESRLRAVEKNRAAGPVMTGRN